MRLKELEDKLEYPIFSSNQVERMFVEEENNSINIQLSRWEKRGELVRLKRGIYKLADREVEEMVVASVMYRPSYVSLETALHYQGVIPEVVNMITSVTTITSKEFENQMGVFVYSKLKKELYFGFKKVKDSKSGMYYQIAEPEKALLDWIYVKGVKDLQASRVDRSLLEEEKLSRWAEKYPDWVGEVID